MHKIQILAALCSLKTLYNLSPSLIFWTWCPFVAYFVIIICLLYSTNCISQTWSDHNPNLNFWLLAPTKMVELNLVKYSIWHSLMTTHIYTLEALIQNLSYSDFALVSVYVCCNRPLWLFILLQPIIIHLVFDIKSQQLYQIQNLWLTLHIKTTLKKSCFISYDNLEKATIVGSAQSFCALTTVYMGCWGARYFLSSSLSTWLYLRYKTPVCMWRRCRIIKSGVSFTKLWDASYDQLTRRRSHELILRTNCYIVLGCVARL